MSLFMKNARKHLNFEMIAISIYPRHLRINQVDASSWIELVKVKSHILNAPHFEKKNCLGGSEQSRHKLGCKITEDGQKLEISDLERRGIVLSIKQKQRC